MQFEKTMSQGLSHMPSQCESDQNQAASLLHGPYLLYSYLNTGIQPRGLSHIVAQMGSSEVSRCRCAWLLGEKPRFGEANSSSRNHPYIK